MATIQQLRNAIARLSGLAQDDVRSLFSGNPTPAALKAALSDILPLLVDQYGAAAAALGSEWYDQHRADSGVGGSFIAEPVAVRAAGAESLASYAVGPLFGADADYTRAKVLLDGGLQRRIANAARETVMSSSVADPFAKGWQRAGSGECAFCAMLIGRGAVYSERTADFSSHDHCACAAVPAFDGQPVPVKPYTPSSSRVTDADRARVREYLRTQ